MSLDALTVRPIAGPRPETAMTDDYAGSTATTGTVAVNGSVSGTLESAGDTDWFAVSLVAGETYSLAMNGIALADPFMTVYDASGQPITSNDDGGFGLNARLDFSPTVTGTYYIEAAAFQGGQTGSYEVVVTQLTSGTGTGETGRNDDYAGDASTSGDLAVGTSITGDLESGGDRDWFALTLAAGESVFIELTGGTLSDPYLTLYDENGDVLLQNDDFNGFDSALSYTATSSETVYIEAAAYDATLTGTYTVSVSPYVVPAYDPLETIDWNAQLPSNTISVFFAPVGYTADGFTSEGFNAYEIARFEEAFERIEAVANVTFQTVTSAFFADLVVILDTNESLGSFLGYFNPPGEVNEGVGVFDGTQWSRSAGGDLEAGGYGFVTLTHELLHAMGLAHPHDEGGGSSIMPGVYAPYDQYGAHLLNQGIFTTMSYNSGYFTGSAGSTGDVNNLWGYEAGPMALDIAVLQQKYGANTTHASGDDFYTLPDDNITGTAWQSIWDTGGDDTLRYGGTRDVVIDLRAATLEDEEGGGGFVSAANGIAGGFTIAGGVVIENAESGEGDDLLQGNDGDNALAGGLGDDTLTGGLGTDTAVLEISRAQVTSFTQVSTGVLQIASANGTDTLVEMELVAFTDQTLTVAEILGDLTGGDVLTGDETPNTLTGTNNNDTMTGGGNNDVLAGNDGDDDMNGGIGADTMTGGGGNDTIVSMEGPDSASGGLGDDSIEGNAGSDTLMGGAGNDTLQGGLGGDLLYGEEDMDLTLGLAGNDVISGNAGADTAYGGAGADTLNGNAGADALYGQAGADLLTGGINNDLLDGGADADTLQGGNGADTLLGSSGADRLEGNAGADSLNGQGGDDVLRGGIGADTFVFEVGSGNDRIADFQNNVDTIMLEQALLSEATPVADDLRNYASLNSDGFLVLTFGTDTLTFTGVTNTGAILDEVVFI